MNIYLLLSQTKKQFANRKSKLQKQHQIAKRETFAKERERERESIWKQKFANTGWAKIFL